ncbi:MAG: adenine deaminase [Actinobacteria bacterium]|nr:adenine deaminase [Actinomycetota bacterium]MBU2687899.1 adenine deaminase [Actinomycetota bacterium]
MELTRMIKLARGGEKVDLLITNCILVDVLSGRAHPAEVAVADGMVVGIDSGYEAERTIDLGGRYLAPGLIDAHVHLESSMVTVPQFARAVVPRGTTAVVTDCHEIANVHGLDGIRYMIDSAGGLPLDVWVMLPPCVPATPLENAGAVLGAADLAKLADHPRVRGMGELMNFPGTIAGAPDVMEKLALFAGRPVEGHAPGLSGKDLAAYVAAGPDSEHECVSAAEAEEKLQKGMRIFMREGTGARNLLDLLPVMNANNSARCCLCTDDRHPADLLERGHIDSLLRMAVGAGVSPLTAVQMATISITGRLGLRDRGAVAPGYRADMVAFDDLEGFNAAMVFKDGRLVASDGRLAEEPGEGPEIPGSFDVKGFGADRLRIAAGGADAVSARVIGVVPEQIVTRALSARVPVRDGEAVADPGSDLLKIAVVERHKGTGNVGVGFVSGFGLKKGALASSVAHDSHNIVVVGCSDADMAAAVERVVALGGGQVAVSAGSTLAEVALPIAGLMSPMPLGEVASAVESLNRAATGLGCVLSDPCMTMSFLALPVIPELKVTDLGLVDVGRFEVVPVLEQA